MFAAGIGMAAGQLIADMYADVLIEDYASQVRFHGAVKSANEDAAEWARVLAVDMRQALHFVAAKNRTTCVLVTTKGVLLAGSAVDGLRQHVRIPAGMPEGTRVYGQHAGISALRLADALKASPLALGIAGPRDICPTCGSEIERRQGWLTSQRTAPW